MYMNIPLSLTSYINIGIALLYLALIIIGYSKGFLFELLSLVYTLAAAVAAWFLAPILASLYPIVKLEQIYPEYGLISELLNLNVMLNIVIYFIIVFFILKVIYWILSVVLKGINKIPVLGTFNKILGSICGIFNATLLCIVLSMLLTLPIFKNGPEIRDKTVLKYANVVTQKCLHYLANNVNIKNIKDEFESFDVDAARQSFKVWLETRN